MNHNLDNCNAFFVNRPLIANAEATRVSSTLRAATLDANDFSEAALRVFLMICLIASLVLGALEMSGPSSTHRTPSLNLPIAAASTGVGFGASIR